MLHQVGVGVLGPVFRTYEPTRDRLVAVKVFRLDITPEAAQGLADELAKAADAGLFHPSIVEPLAAGVEGTVAYRAEEYVAAESLDVAMRHYSPAAIEKALPIITQLAGAIDFARTAGVGHGALHPRDVFVSPDETRVTGFGVVEALERVGLRAPVRRPYSAPERVAGGSWSTAADVFSLAAITYELLTGRRPAGTGTQIGDLPDDAAPGLHDVLARAMSEAPEERYQTALEFVGALDAAVNGEVETAAVPAARVSAAPVVMPVDVAAADEFAHETADALPASHDAAPFSDIDVERDEDEAHVGLLGSEQVTDDDAHASRTLFDDEAIEDLAIEGTRRDETERFADEFAAAAPLHTSDLASADAVEDDRLDVDTRAVLRTDDEDFQGYENPEPAAATGRVSPAAFSTLNLGGDVDDTSSASRSPRYETAPAAYGDPVRHDRPAMSRLLVWSFLLLVGFAVGYIVRGTVDRPDEAAGSQATAAAGSGEPATQKPPQSYSEQAVNPPKPPAQDTIAGSTPPAAAPAQADTPPVAAPAARETPAPASGRLVIRSTPAGAAVTIDGTWRGRTPLTLDDVSLGAHSVRVVQSGYNTATEDVRLSTAAPSRTLTFRLQRTPAAPRAERPAARAPERTPAAPQKFTGTIFVDSRPRGARVLLNGKDMGTTPVRIPEVPIGSHVVRLQLDDHRDWSTSTRVTSGQDVRVTGSLERIR